MKADRARECRSAEARRRLPLGVAVLFICAWALVGVACSRSESPPSLASQLEGTWHLQTLGGRPISETRIAEWHLEFLKCGKCRYGGTMSGPFRGMQISGDGRWYIRQRTLVYSAGEAHGASVVLLNGNELTLQPDPILLNSQQKPATSFYTKFHAFGR